MGVFAAIRRRLSPAQAVALPRDLSAVFGPSEPLAMGERQVGTSGPSFRAAKITRNNAIWQPRQTSGDAAIADSPLLHTRYRDLALNEPSIVNAKRKMTAHIVGCGHQTFADVEIGDAIEDEYNDESDAWFERWCAGECDVERRMHFGELQRAGFGEEFGGDCLLLECFDNSPGRSVPLCYQLLEPEQLDRAQDRPATETLNKIVGGIELDRFNRPLAYYIFDAHPYDAWSGWTASSTRIPAARVLHSYVPFRPSATRGVNWCHAILQAARDLDTFMDSELTSSIIASMFAVVINRERGAGTGLGFAFEDDGTLNADAAGNTFTRLGKGIVADVGANDKVTQVESKRPSPLIDALVKVIRNQESMGIGMSFPRLTGDYSGLSYSSARAAHLDDQAVFEPIQEHFAQRIVLPMRSRHNDLAVAMGRIRSITPTMYRNDPFRWRTFDFYPPGREQLDPEGETESAAARMRIGISTLKQECALRGLNYRKVLRQARKEKRLIGDYELDGWINFSKGGGAPEQAAREARQTARDAVPMEAPGKARPARQTVPADDKEAA